MSSAIRCRGCHPVDRSARAGYPSGGAGPPRRNGRVGASGSIAVCILVCVVGCLGDWRPESLEDSRGGQSQATTRPNGRLDPCEVFNRPGRWVYQRRELPAHADETPTSYTREVDGMRVREGSLLDRPFEALIRYLKIPENPLLDDGRKRRPEAPLPEPISIFFRLDEPVAPIPPDLRSTGRAESSTNIRYFYKEGNPIASGRLTRVAEIEGYEDVECPAGRFESCLRVRVDLRISFPLTPIVDWTTYLWLSPEVGEVRRVHSFTGWFLIFWFGSAQEYLLESCSLPDRPPVAGEVPAEWSEAVVVFDRGIPHPRISGFVVDMK